MTAREMQVHGCVRKFRVSQKNLNGSEVSTSFQHVRCEAVPQRMRETRLVIPERSAASLTATHTTLWLMGTSARQLFTMPGNR